MKKLTVQRLDTANYMRQIGIYCDGQKLGTLGFAERQDFEIPENAEKVYAKIDWCRSEPFALSSGQPDEVLFLECNNSAKNIIFNTNQYLKLHQVKRAELPTQKELKAFKHNFRKVAGLSTFMLLLFTAFLLYTLYVAIYENSPIWYVLTALAAYNVYRIGKGMRTRLKGQVE